MGSVLRFRVNDDPGVVLLGRISSRDRSDPSSCDVCLPERICLGLVVWDCFGAQRSRIVVEPLPARNLSSRSSGMSAPRNMPQVTYPLAPTPCIRMSSSERGSKFKVLQFRSLHLEAIPSHAKNASKCSLSPTSEPEMRLYGCLHIIRTAPGLSSKGTLLSWAWMGFFG